jgi:hypothetical protein
MDPLKAAAALGSLIFAMTISRMPCNAAGQDPTTESAPKTPSGVQAIEQLRTEIAQMKAQYEDRIKQMEIRLEELQGKCCVMCPGPRLQRRPISPSPHPKRWQGQSCNFSCWEPGRARRFESIQ